MNTDSTAKRPLLGQLSLFYFPLALQAISMSLTYPLVGAVVAHGPYGADEYAIMAQAQAIMFLVGSIGNGLISTGMIFAKTKRGLNNFAALSISLGLSAIFMQTVCCFPPFDHLIFARLYHLDGELFTLARKILLLSVPMNFAFFIRNTGLAVLFREKRTDKATFATFFRIGLTWICSVVFVKSNLVGWQWGLGLTTVAVWIESLMVNILAIPYKRNLPSTAEDDATIGRQYAFTIPLSLGGMMICISGTMIPIFLALTSDPVIARKIHYIAFGILNPLTFSAARLQSVVIAFPPSNYKKGAIFLFSLSIGVLMSGLSLLLQIPGIANWYFGSYQNLLEHEIPLAMKAMLFIGLIPLVVSVKSFCEGLAAIIMRPNAILAEQIAYLAAQVLVFFALVQLKPIDGYLMSSVSIFAAQLFSLLVIRIALRANRIADKFGVSHSSHRQI